MNIYSEINFKAAAISLSVAFPFEWWRRWWSYDWRRWSTQPSVTPYVAEPSDFRPTENEALLNIQREALEALETRRQIRLARRHGRR